MFSRDRRSITDIFMLHPRKLTPANWALICVGFYFLVVIHAVLPNNGGTDGDNFPWVINGWLMMCLMMAGVWLLLPMRSWRITPTFKCLLLASVLLTLPIFWSPNIGWKYHAIPRLAGLWGGLGLYFTFLQCRFTQQQWYFIFGVIALSAFMQTLFVIAEIYFYSWLPELTQAVTQNGKLGFGVFQQRNVTASFIATGILISAIAFVFVHKYSAVARTIWWLSAISIVLSSALLILLCSRVGWLGVIFGLCLLLFLLRFHSGVENKFGREKWLVLLIISGIVLGVIGFYCEPDIFYLATANISKEGSNAQRWLTLKSSAAMFLQHPWIGWGYGGFEYCFQHWIATQMPPIISQEMMNHPHNEIMFWAVEGGITALLGLAVVVVSVLCLIARHFTLQKALVGIITTPVLLHLQTEYPLYQSMAHWLILILCIAGLEQEASQPEISNKKMIVRYVQAIFAVLSIGGVILSGVALRNEIILTEFELSHLPDSEAITRLSFTWLAYDRIQHDLALLGIVRFGRTHNVINLQESVIRTRELLKTRTDADMYNNMINMQYYLGAIKQANLDRKDAEELFPYDKRF